jgi:hypothetical protein
MGRSAESITYPEEQIRILNVDPSVPVRMSANMQVIAGIGVDYSLTERLSFTAEPTFRYYLSDEYQNTGNYNGKPYAVGFRVGFRYNFIKD